MSKNQELFFGEFLGTLILVFFGCSSVALAVTGILDLSLLTVALIWGGAVFIAITISSRWCPAHLNPAVTLAFHLREKFPRKKLLILLSGQMIGAFMAGVLVLLIFNSTIVKYEEINNIERGIYPAYKSAVMFGEFFPNPGYEGKYRVGSVMAMFFEGVGTMALMLVILLSGKLPNKYSIQPLLIAVTLVLLIYFIAPFTQAGFNPFRDFMPRMVAFMAGWGIEAFPYEVSTAFTVYILSPIVGASIASIVFTKYLD